MMANGKQTCFSAKSKPTAKSELTEEFPSIEKFNWLINLQHARGELKACKDLIKREIERSNGKNEFAYFKQGEILREEGKLQEALDSFHVCLKLNPESSANFKEVAKCLYDMKRYKLCMEAYLQAESVSKSPDWQIYYFLGQCLMKLGDLTKAKDYAQKAVKIGKHEICYTLLIKILTSEGDIKSALAVSNAAVESCPDSADMLRESGLLHLKLGQSQQAFERLSSALALDPNNSKVLLGIGYITQKHEEYDVALTKYKIAVHHEPDSVALWNNIGMCFYSKQKYVAAISCLKRALWMQPLNWQTLYNLSLAYLATSQPASAFNFACAAVNLRPDVADCYALMGAALLTLKDAKNAASALRKTVSLAPTDPISAANAALCCFQAGCEEEAAEMLRKFEMCVERGAESTEELLKAMELADKLSAKLEEKLQADEQSNAAVSEQPKEKPPTMAEVGTRRELMEDEV